MTNQSSLRLRKLVVAGMLAALAYAVVFVMPIRVQFLTFDAKDAIIAIASLFLGPVYGLVLAIVVPFIEMVTISETHFYGFLMNFFSSATFACACGLFYQKRRNLSGAISGVVISVFAMTTVMLVANTLVTPYYMNLTMGLDLNVAQKTVYKMLPTLILPFNLTKSALNAGITLLLYKPFTTAIRATKLLPVDKDGAKFKFGAKTIILFAVAIVIIAAALFVFFKLLGASL